MIIRKLLSWPRIELLNCFYMNRLTQEKKLLKQDPTIIKHYY